jgi:hypothetical protein
MFGTTHPTGSVPFVPAGEQYGPLGYALVTAPPSAPLEDAPEPEPPALEPVPLEPPPLDPAPPEPVPLDPAPPEPVPVDPVPLDPVGLPLLLELAPLPAPCAPLLDSLPPFDPAPGPPLPLPEHAGKAVDTATSEPIEASQIHEIDRAAVLVRIASLSLVRRAR